MTLDNWLEEHFDEEEEFYTFAPDELIFNIQIMDNVGEVAVITPKRYYEEEGYQFDQHFEIEGLDWIAVTEGVYETEGPNPWRQLLELGMEENINL